MVRYFDHAATTELSPVARAAIEHEFEQVGNASSLHVAGRRARRVVEESREEIAAVLGVPAGNLIFTSGGTEADNMGVLGAFRAHRRHDPRRDVIIASPTEHHAVLDVLAWLEANVAAEVHWLPVTETGQVLPQTLAAAIAEVGERANLVAIMWANNETGVVQPIPELAHLAEQAGLAFHIDAVQALAHLPLDLQQAPHATVAITAHKLGGPIGIGALVAPREAVLEPLMHGGGQERKLRSGTLDTPGIAGFAAAVGELAELRPMREERMWELRELLITGLRAQVPDIQINEHPQREYQLPAIVHATFPECEGDALLMLLDAQQIACSTGSACSAGVPQPSHVLLAMGRSEAQARGSLRLSLGVSTTEADIAALVAAIGPAVAQARRVGQRSRRERVRG